MRVLFSIDFYNTASFLLDMAGVKKIVSIITIAFVIVNLIAYGAGWVGAIPFWIVIGCCALIAFVLVPRFK